MAVNVTHTKTLVAPDSGVEDKIYGEDYVAADSHTVEGLGSAAETASSDYATSSHAHSASAITSSTLALARMGAGTPNISTFLAGDGNWLVPVYTNLSSLPVLGTAASTSHLNYAVSTHAHSASDITSSTLALARIAGGTYNASTFLAGTSTFAQPSFSSLANMPTLGTAASTAAANYATAAQGATADAAQPGDAQLTAIAGLAYAGNALKTIRVVASEDGFELATASAAVAWGAITGTVTDQVDLSTVYALTAHVHSASDINSSTLALARIAGGTYNASTFLRGTSSFAQPSFSSLANMPDLGTAASTSHLDYASSTHHASSATHTFPGGTVNFLRADGTFAAPAGGTSPISTVKVSSIKFTTTTSSFAIPELAFTVSNTIAYAFEFGVLYATAISSTGLRLGLNAPAFSSYAALIKIPTVLAAGTDNELTGWISSTASTLVATTTPTASTKYFARMSGSIVPSANGTLQAIYATEIAGSAVSTFVGGYGILTIL